MREITEQQIEDYCRAGMTEMRLTIYCRTAYINTSKWRMKRFEEFFLLRKAVVNEKIVLHYSTVW
jgi:phage terminase large subunit